MPAEHSVPRHCQAVCLFTPPTRQLFTVYVCLYHTAPMTLLHYNWRNNGVYIVRSAIRNGQVLFKSNKSRLVVIFRQTR